MRLFRSRGRSHSFQTSAVAAKLATTHTWAVKSFLKTSVFQTSGQNTLSKLSSTVPPNIKRIARTTTSLAFASFEAGIFHLSRWAQAVGARVEYGFSIVVASSAAPRRAGVAGSTVSFRV